MTTIEIHGIKQFFEFKDFMHSKGFTYTANQNIKASFGLNYFKIDELGMFALISKEEYLNLNNRPK